MTPWQIWWIVEDNLPDGPAQNLTQTDLDEIEIMVAASKKKEAEANG